MAELRETGEDRENPSEANALWKLGNHVETVRIIKTGLNARREKGNSCHV
jgi:hypothetical protein